MLIIFFQLQYVTLVDCWILHFTKNSRHLVETLNESELIFSTIGSLLHEINVYLSRVNCNGLFFAPTTQGP